MKDSFILYNSFYEPIKELKNEQLGKLLRAIFDYTINGEITQDNDILIAFMFIKNQIDMDTRKWEDTKEKRKYAGMLGGIQKAINNKQELSSKSKQNLDMLSNAKQSQANQAVNVNENDNVNVNVDVNDNIYEYIEKLFGAKTFNQTEYEIMTNWEDNEITRYAIDKATSNGKYNIKYIDKIIFNYKKNNIKTVQQAEELDKSFKDKTNNKADVPEWFDKNLNEKEIEYTKEEQEIYDYITSDD